jgi:DNA polymerase-3 subunit epsilon
MLGATSLTDGSFVAVDIETTGCRPGSSGIIEIGAALIRAGVIVECFETLVRPDEAIPHAIQHLTGIDDDMVADAPDVASVMHKLRDFVGDAVLVAHNHRFDMGFLDFEAERAWGTSFKRPVLDTLTLARRLHPELDRHNLRVLAAYYDVDAVPNHRASADALATAQILQKMMPELANRGMATAEDVSRFCGQARQGMLASKLVIATHLPDSPGVFLFRNADNEVIYIGRAKSLRSRVRGYFYGPSDLDRPHPASEAASVDHFPCASDLDALLVESRLVARYQPKFNKDQQRGRSQVFIRLGGSAKFPALTTTNRRLRSGTIIGPLTNNWAADTLVEALRSRYGLRRCARRFGKDSVACAEGEAGRCPRPCEGAITADEYARRVEAALAVFNGGGPRFRAAMQALRERAAADLHYEEAILHRDAVRALDRTLSSLEVVRFAASELGVAIVEGRGDDIVILLVRHGRLGCVLRFDRAEVAGSEFRVSLERAVARTYSDTRLAEDPMDISPRELRDVFIIETYRRQHLPQEVLYKGDVESFIAHVATAARRATRVPRKLHAAPSGD